MRAIITLVLGAVASCTPPKPGANAAGTLATSTSEGSGAASAGDAGVPRVCMHDAKDLAPCSEDCDRGIAFACTVVAGRIERGEGAPKDLTRAVVLHERACELRDPASCMSAARMHASGSGVPPNRAKQIALLETACKLGEASSCAIAAKAFAKGSDVPRDVNRAKDLRQQACLHGMSEACEELNEP
jgi:uncharacterized protein